MIKIIRKKTKLIPVTIAFGLFFSSCGGENSNKIVGYLLDAPVANMSYQCGKIRGKTASDGEFECSSLPITFTIGNFEVGTLNQMTHDGKVYPQDLVGVSRDKISDPEVLKVASFLQSIDDDGDISKSITLPDSLEFSSSKDLSEMSYDDIVKLLEINGIKAVSLEDAKEHLQANFLGERDSVVAGVTHDEESPPIVDSSSDGEESESVVDHQDVVTVSTIPTGGVSIGGTTTHPLTPSDTTPPATNATIDTVVTDDITPPLSGNLPSGEDDLNTTNYTIRVKVDDNSYDATNDKDGTWSIADNIISALTKGYHDVNISVTDEAGNSSSTYIANKIEIDNTGFLIDSAVEGIKYVSGAFSGYTDQDGLFKYDKDAGVSFYVGDESTGVSLGSAGIKVDPYNSNRRIITLFDLADTVDENSPKVVNRGKFLQSLDSDGDVSNGITIDQQTRESIALLNLKNHIDFNQDIEAFHNNTDIYNLMNDLAGHFGEHRGLLPTEDVQAHLVAVRDNRLSTLNLSTDKVSGEKEEIEVLDAVFKSINGAVEGLEYRSGNQFGRTDANGAFKYEDGKKVKFSIYQLELGITEAKAVVTPADLVPSTSFNHPKPRNIIRLLNAFDAISGDDKITIDSAVREALEKYRSQIDINLPDGKANAELGIAKGEDEFGSQFDDFEMGKEILDEIDRLRS